MRAHPARFVVAVVPLYRPGRAQLLALTALASQVDHVVAVDDGSGRHIDLGDARTGVTLVTCRSNSGIGRALNIGVTRARELGATHVLTIDQDSRLTDDYVEAAFAALDDARARGIRVGGIGAGLIGPHRVEGAHLGGGLRDGTEGVQSGWLIPVARFDEVGLFDESLFIDCVDVDFLMRAWLVGHPIAVSDRCAIEHSLGAEEHTVRLLGRTMTFSYHPPFRRYYITRNRITMLRRYAASRPRAIISQSVAAVRIALLCIWAGGGRTAQVVAIGAGVADGLRGRPGRIPPRLQRLLDEVA